MARRNVMIQLRYAPDLAPQASTEAGRRIDTAASPRLADLPIDPTYAPVPLRTLTTRERSQDPNDLSAAVQLDLTPTSTTYIVRGEVDEAQVPALRAREDVVGVFSDPVIEPCIVCASSAPVGTDLDVETLLCANSMRKCGMDGTGVLVAIVDSGVNMTYLNNHGKTPGFNAAWSWAYTSGLTPGSMPVDHGTMVAFDVCIAAPKCTILDIALLHPIQATPSGFGGLLSDAVKAYAHLLDIMMLPLRIGQKRSMVVNNSWGMFNPSWDYPVSDPGNYSDNPNHPFNIAVASLEIGGADIVFAAGNCGADCPDSRCQGITSNTIYGANGHPQVLTVGGVDTTQNRVGYSAIGPGRLATNKPDVCGYTHFTGSEVYTADGGTSAAAPVVTGVVAAVRSKRPRDAADATTSPAAIRSLITSTANDLGTSGFDFMHGHGVVDTCEIGEKVCGPAWWIFNICKLHPWICEGVFRWPPIPLPWPDPIVRWVEQPGLPFRMPSLIGTRSVAPPPGVDQTELVGRLVERLAAESGVTDSTQLGYVLGSLSAQIQANSPGTQSRSSSASMGQDRED